MGDESPFSAPGSPGWDSDDTGQGQGLLYFLGSQGCGSALDLPLGTVIWPVTPKPKCAICSEIISSGKKMGLNSSLLELTFAT